MAGGILTSPFGTPEASAPLLSFRRDWWFGDPDSFAGSNSFTISNTNNTAAGACVGGRPCMQITNGNTSATADLSNYCVQTASIIPQPGKNLRYRCSWQASEITTDQAFGFGVVGTSMITTDPTNHIMIRKLSAETVFSLRVRKASGTVQTFPLNMPIVAVNTWYDFSITIRQDSGSTAGNGHIDVWYAVAGGPMQFGGSFNVVGAFPDTVAMAPFFSQRAGAVSTGTTAIGFIGAEQEA